MPFFICPPPELLPVLRPLVRHPSPGFELGTVHSEQTKANALDRSATVPAIYAP